MQNSSLPNEAKPTSKTWKYIKRIGIGIAVLFIIIVIAAIVDSSNDPKPTAQQNNAEQTQVQGEPFNIEVESQIVKKVDGKYRYFFDVRNKDTKNFEGSVTIELVNGKGQKLGQDTFTTTKPIEPNLGTSQYLDINSGPVPIFDIETGITKFTYEVRVNNRLAKKGEGQITSKFENLSVN